MNRFVRVLTSVPSSESVRQIKELSRMSKGCFASDLFFTDCMETKLVTDWSSLQRADAFKTQSQALTPNVEHETLVRDENDIFLL